MPRPRRLWLAMLVALFALSTFLFPVVSASTEPFEPAPKGRAFHPSRIVIQLKNGRIETRPAKPGESVAAAVARLQKDPNVLLAEPDYVASGAQLTPNDPLFAQQYALTKVNAPAAWDTTTGSATVPVCIPDTGVDYNHPDLQGQMHATYGKGVSFVDTSKDGMDDHGHGTASASIIGAAANNSQGMTGVSWKAAIAPCKWLDKTNYGYLSNAVKCLDWCTTTVGANITNNSWGTTTNSAILKSKVAELSKKGSLMIVAAGNQAKNIDSSRTMFYPASYADAGILSVGSTNSSDGYSTFSNYGAKNVDIAAPGEGVMAAGLGGTYALQSGTSFSTPHVTGAALLAKAKKPGATAAQIKAAILNSRRAVPALSTKVLSGGILDVAGAVNSV